MLIRYNELNNDNDTGSLVNHCPLEFASVRQEDIFPHEIIPWPSEFFHTGNPTESEIIINDNASHLSNYSDNDYKWMVDESYILENCYEVRISYPRVTQKSYGKEKRFISPPPLIEIGGLLVSQDVYDDNYHYETDPHVCVHLGVLNEKAYSLIRYKDRHYVARSVYANDSESLKETRFCVKIHMKKSLQYIGDFCSFPIDVISKPTVKKSSTTGNLIISSGMSIALYNRIKSQASSTMFLYLANGRKIFNTSNELWSSVKIYLISSDQSEINNTEELVCTEGEISVGSLVLLRDERYGISFPPLIIRKIEKDGINFSITKEPIYQLHRYALEVANNHKHFIACDRGGKIAFLKMSDNQENKTFVMDICRWTIVQATSHLYRWYCVDKNALRLCPSVNVTDLGALNTVPTITLVNVLSCDTNVLLEVRGRDFLPVHHVCIGRKRAFTFYRCSELLIAHIPDKKILQSSISFPAEVPIAIVHPDGFVFPTEISASLF